MLILFSERHFMDEKFFLKVGFVQGHLGRMVYVTVERGGEATLVLTTHHLRIYNREQEVRSRLENYGFTLETSEEGPLHIVVFRSLRNSAVVLAPRGNGEYYSLAMQCNGVVVVNPA